MQGKARGGGEKKIERGPSRKGVKSNDNNNYIINDRM